MAPTCCGIPKCTWTKKKMGTDPRALFQVSKYVKGDEKKKDRDMLYKFLSSLRDDREYFEDSYHKGK